MLSPPQRPSRPAKGRQPQALESTKSPSQPKEFRRWKLQDGVNKKAISLDQDKMKTIYRWMWQHSTRTAKGHEFEFKLLLATLGFNDAAFSPQLRKQLRTKVYDQIRHNSEGLKRLGAVTMALDGNKKKVVQFAEWTEGWASSDSWNGDPRPPNWTQVFFNPYFGEARGWLHLKALVSSKKDSDSPPVPGRLVVEEPEATDLASHQSNNNGQSRGSDITTPEAFDFLCRPYLAVSSPIYDVDVSELPQYHGAQLTPTDPNHPLRSDPRFVPLDLDFGGDVYEEENFGDEGHEYYEDHDGFEARTEYQADDDTMGSEMPVELGTSHFTSINFDCH